MFADDDAPASQAPEHQSDTISTREVASGSHVVVSEVSRRRVRVLSPEKLNPETAVGPGSVIDAAALLVKVAGSMSRGKLQDLLYFAQAWHLVWDNELLYPDPIIATDDGVRIEVVESLIGSAFTVTAEQLRKGKPKQLTESQQGTLLGVTNFYANRNHYRLSEQIRGSAPWQQARSSDGDPVIEPAALLRYYRET